VPDPAVVVFTLQQAGFDPRLLTAGARAALAERFGTDLVVVPRLTAFPGLARPAGVSARARADDEAVFDAFGATAETPVHFSAVAVRCDSGDVVRGGSRYLVPENAVGIFGTSRSVPASRRFRTAADHIVQQLFPTQASG